MNADDRHPSDLALDRGGEAVDAHVAACALCQERVDVARDARERFEREVLPATLPAIRARLRGGAPKRRWLWFALPVVAAAAVMLFIRGREPSPPPYYGVKGQAALFPGGLEIVLRRGEKVATMTPDQRLRAGDALRFVYRGDRPRHLELRMADAAGRLALFYPDGGPAPLVRPGEALPGAAVVDGSGTAEELVVRLSDVSFDTTDEHAATQVHRIRLERE